MAKTDIEKIESLGYEVLSADGAWMLARYGDWFGFGFSENFEDPEEFPMMQCGDLESVIEMLEVQPDYFTEKFAKALKNYESEELKR